jgi:hypothetical protein
MIVVHINTTGPLSFTVVLPSTIAKPDNATNELKTNRKTYIMPLYIAPGMTAATISTARAGPVRASPATIACVRFMRPVLCTDG